MRYMRMRSRAPEVHREDRGAAMVEFALVAMIMIVLVMGIINFGYLFGQKLALNQAVREGARAAVVPEGLDGSSLQTKINNAAGGMLPNAITVSGDPATFCQSPGIGQDMKVRASYTTDLLTPMPIPGFQSTFTLNSEAVFRCEY